MTLVVIFYFDIWDLDTDPGVRPAAKRRNNAGLPSGKFCKGVKRSETIPSPLPKIKSGLSRFCFWYSREWMRTPGPTTSRFRKRRRTEIVTVAAQAFMPSESLRRYQKFKPGVYPSFNFVKRQKFPFIFLLMINHNLLCSPHQFFRPTMFLYHKQKHHLWLFYEHNYLLFRWHMQCMLKHHPKNFPC